MAWSIVCKLITVDSPSFINISFHRYMTCIHYSFDIWCWAMTQYPSTWMSGWLSAPYMYIDYNNVLTTGNHMKSFCDCLFAPIVLITVHISSHRIGVMEQMVGVKRKCLIKNKVSHLGDKRVTNFMHVPCVEIREQWLSRSWGTFAVWHVFGIKIPWWNFLRFSSALQIISTKRQLAAQILCTKGWLVMSYKTEILLCFTPKLSVVRTSDWPLKSVALLPLHVFSVKNWLNSWNCLSVKCLFVPYWNNTTHSFTKSKF